VTDKKKYLYWLAVEESKTVRFADLAHMMAIAMHPSEAEEYAAARINLEHELPEAVRNGLLKVRNPAGMGLHTFPHGDALQRAVLIPDTDLKPFLNERGIELCLTPHGSGPVYWTLENAAAALQEQELWHDGTRRKFQDQLKEAAQSKALVVLDPQTCLPTSSKDIRTYWEYVSPANVNAWLKKQGETYHWRCPEWDAQYARALEDLDKKETPEQRRARWLDMLEVEEKRKERGALQRVADREGVDRSNMSKDIEKARAIRTERKRAGLCGSQLVQNGKRKG
jgi:hypothetical protein